MRTKTAVFKKLTWGRLSFGLKLGTEIKGRQGTWSKSYENGSEQHFFVITFDIYYAALKIVTYIMS